MNEDPKRKAVAEAFADFTTQLEKDAPHMNANEITESWGEWWKAKIDLGITGYSAGSGAFSVAKGITTLIEGEISGLETAGTCVSVVGAGLSGVTAVKNFIQAGIGQYRQNYVADIKSRNKEDLKKSKEDLQKLKEEGKTLEADSAEAKEHQKKVAVAEKGQQEAQNINTMSKVSKSDNKNKKWMYVAAGTTAATSCALGITGVATTIGLPVTIAGGLVAGIGFGVNYVIQNVAQKNPAKKSVDNQMKLEDTDYVPQKDENGKGKRYIDTKVDERRQMLEEKKERFRQGTENYKNTNYYLKKTDKLKGRIRTNYTVKHNCATILTYRAENDKENANIAYRHVFLRDPDGPINDQNLLKPEEVKMYLSTKPEDLQRTGQTQKDAQQRNM